MIVGSPKEIFKGEARVAMTPESAKQIQKLGYTCILETGAGLQSNFSDKDYRESEKHRAAGLEGQLNIETMD